jgi:hypothetical protein
LSARTKSCERWSKHLPRECVETEGNKHLTGNEHFVCPLSWQSNSELWMSCIPSIGHVRCQENRGHKQNDPQTDIAADIQYSIESSRLSNRASLSVNFDLILKFRLYQVFLMIWYTEMTLFMY